MDFPMDPHELPNFAAIYKDDEPVELDETIVLQQRAPALRKSNKTIRPSTVAQAVVPAASAVPNEPSGWMQQMMMFSQFMQQQQQQAQQQGGHEVVHLLQPRGAKRQKALMPPDASDTPTAPAAPPAATCSIPSTTCGICSTACSICSTACSTHRGASYTTTSSCTSARFTAFGT